MADFSLASLKAEIDKFLSVNVDQKGKKVSKVKNVFKNCIVVLNQSANALPYHKELIQRELGLFEQQKKSMQKYFFVRDDQIDEIKEILYPGKNYELLLQKIREFISDDDYGALRYAAVICNKENNGVDNHEYISKLSKAYKSRGLTLYNFLRCGDVFPNEIFPLLSSLQKINRTGAHEAFRPYWESLVKYHPNRIFVSGSMHKEDLEEQILKRTLIHKIKKVYIYSRGRKIPFTDKTIRGLLFQVLPHYGIRLKKYQLGNSLGETHTIFLRKS